MLSVPFFTTFVIHLVNNALQLYFVHSFFYYHSSLFYTDVVILSLLFCNQYMQINIVGSYPLVCTGLKMLYKTENFFHLHRLTKNGISWN
ncbi:hypothetical protein GDO78_007650 [Eleutherodactylus coqui]|uniref:Uncharacterized protein n=1 Tax=Eleutherodactylus coqui TaxID=57060 RepID=A0A8J6FH36_ELECQ|nr:hypothetical protein GDO78_007650 [Eleutherodactylus coqui]